MHRNSLNIKRLKDDLSEHHDAHKSPRQTQNDKV